MMRYSMLAPAVAMIAIAEFLVMKIIDLLAIPNGYWQYAIDSTLLAFLTAPLLYWMLARAGAIGKKETKQSAVDHPVGNLEELERQALLKALEAAHGNRTGAAQILGIGRSTVYRKVKKFGLGGALEV